MRRAFTLIELLIVVAIIAILAAIAVPNFLEAQVRSKVARVKADQRTLATALEAYTIDANRCPMYINELWAMCKATPPGGVQYQALTPLTTPIAYVTSLPNDPFVSNNFTLLPGGWKYLTFRYETQVSAPKWTPGPSQVLMQRALDRGYVWSLCSYGPTRRGMKPTNQQWVTIYCMLGGDTGHGPWVYDASNGTVSYGFIVRTNKGDLNGNDFKGIY